MEDCLRLLAKEGWQPCAEKIRTQLDKQKEDVPDVENVFLKDPKKWMLNEDIKEVAKPSLPDGINSGRITTLSTPTILQVKKVVNIAAPSYNQRSDGAPRMLKISLTDGKFTCHGLEYSYLPRFSLDVPMGAKVRLSGTVRLSHGLILLDDKNCQLLGGDVPHLLQEWRMQQMLLSHVRAGAGDDGPPPFVPFGQKIKRADEDLKKSFEEKENAVADEGFLSQRQDAIAAAAQSNASTSIIKGSGKKLEMHQPERRGRGRGQRERRSREDREEAQKPRESLSLFDYLHPGIKEETPIQEDYLDDEGDIQDSVLDERPSWERDGIYRPPGRRENERYASGPPRFNQSSRGHNSYGNVRDERHQNAPSYGGPGNDRDNSYQGRGGRRGRGDSRGRRASRGRRGGYQQRDIEDSYLDDRSFHRNSSSSSTRNQVDVLTADFSSWPGLETRENNRPSEKTTSHPAWTGSREQWAIHDYCLAKWESTDQYYPAVIEQLIPDCRAVTVMFVETGAVRIVETKHLLRDPQDAGGSGGQPLAGHQRSPGHSRGSSTRIFTSRNRGRY